MVAFIVLSRQTLPCVHTASIFPRDRASRVQELMGDDDVCTNGCSFACVCVFVCARDSDLTDWRAIKLSRCRVSSPARFSLRRFVGLDEISPSLLSWVASSLRTRVFLS